LRFWLREELRPLELELRLLLSLGACVSESLSTRLDSVFAPDLLCVDEDRFDPEDRLRELEGEREEDPLFDFFEEELPPERLLLLDRDFDFCLGILPSLLLLSGWDFVPRLPEPRGSNTRDSG
jgi:hypothetical protein